MLLPHRIIVGSSAPPIISIQARSVCTSGEKESVAGVVSLKRLLNQSNLKSWSSKMIKKSLEAYFFTLKNKIVFCKKQF